MFDDEKEQRGFEVSANELEERVHNPDEMLLLDWGDGQRDVGWGLFAHADKDGFHEACKDAGLLTWLEEFEWVTRAGGESSPESNSDDERDASETHSQHIGVESGVARMVDDNITRA